MAFTLETGDSISGANAYVDAAFVDTYHLDRLNLGWSGADDAKEAAIIKASEYIDKRFGRKFRGTKKTSTQGLEWPRHSALDNDGLLYPALPEPLKKAVAEYALRAFTLTNLMADPSIGFTDRDSTGAGSTQGGTPGGQITSDRKRVGPIEVEQRFARVTGLEVPHGSTVVSGHLLPAYPDADLLIEELLESAQATTLGRGD